jgi:hypothetical protein
MKNAFQICILFISVALIFLLTSCGGGGGSDGSGPDATNVTPQSTGTVGILLTDKPADLSLFTSINATIKSVELLGDDEGGKVTIYSGPPKTYDLLKLTHEAIPFTFKDDVPVGTYCKIRLILSDLELVLTDDTPDDLTDNPTEHPNLPGNGKLDLVAQNCFEVGPGEVVTLQIDIDAGNSIHIVEKGNNKGYNFRPVVFVDVLSESFSGKLVRLEGKITESDEDQQSLLLCDVSTPLYTESLGCVEVYFGEDSAFFDNKSYEGTPRPLNELFDIEIGEVISIVGWPRHSVQSSPDGVVDDPYRPYMELDALVAELGDFLTLNGNVTEDADSSGFYMNVRPGEPILTDSPIGVVLQGAPVGGNGTRIVSKSGLLLDFNSVVVPKMVQVDSTLLIGTEDLLYAALVIVDTKSSEQVSGEILGFDDDSLTLLAPDTETVCGSEVVDQIVIGYSSDTKFFTVTIYDTTSTIMPGGDLEVGQNVGVNISCDSPAESIVIIEDQRIEVPVE